MTDDSNKTPGPEDTGQFSRRRGGTFKSGSASGPKPRSTGRAVTKQRTSYLRHDDGSYQPPRGGTSHKGAIVAAILIVAVIICGGVFAYLHFGGHNASADPGQQVTIKVEEGSSTKIIAEQLADAGVVDSARGFRRYVVDQGLESSLLPGEYVMYTGMEYDAVLNQLANGSGTTDIVLAIPEGYTKEQTAERVQEACGIPAADFLALCNNASAYEDRYPFVQGAYNNSLEGFLFPKTYTFEAGVDADTVVCAMLDQFQYEFSTVNLSYAQDQGLSAYDVVIMASCIEKETLFDEDRPHVAGVIYNRLAQDMRLGLDCTAAYASGVFGQQLTSEQLEVESPYNTYVNFGLPAGPICSPGLASLSAAAAPQKTEDLYFILTEDYSHFYVTYEDFLEGKKAWQEGK